MLIGADVHVYNDLKRLRGARLPALTILVAPNPDAIAASYILTVHMPIGWGEAGPDLIIFPRAVDSQTRGRAVRATSHQGL